MSKRYQMRWSDADVDRLNKTVKNFNAKINRVIKKDPTAVSRLPQKITKKDLSDKITTRQEFNRLISSYQRFSKKGSEKQAETPHRTQATQWEVNEFNIKKRLENQRRAYERKRKEKIELKSRGQPLGYSRVGMDSSEINALQPVKTKFEDMTQKEWDVKSKNIDKFLFEKNLKAKKQQYLDNYIQAMTNEGIDSEIIDFVSTLDLDKFIKIIESDIDAVIGFVYDKIQLELKNQTLRKVWGMNEND